MTSSARIFSAFFLSILCFSQAASAQNLTWKDPSKLLSITYDQFRQSFPSDCKKLKAVKDTPDQSRCFINGHVDSFMSNANGANLIFEHGKISSIEFSVWRGNGSPDGIIARYGTFDDPDHAGAEKVNLSTVGRQNARKYFWTKTGYGIVWEQYFTKSFSDALAFNGDTERIWFVITDKSALK